jgi:hypothetical protein
MDIQSPQEDPPDTIQDQHQEQWENLVTEKMAELFGKENELQEDR